MTADSTPDAWHSPKWGGYPVDGDVSLTDGRGISTGVSVDIEYAVEAADGHQLKRWKTIGHVTDLIELAGVQRRHPGSRLLARAVSPAWEVPS